MKEISPEEASDLVRKHCELEKLEPENEMFRYMKSNDDKTEVMFVGTPENAYEFLKLIHKKFPSREQLSRVKGRDVDKIEYYTRLSFYLLRQYSKALDDELLKADNNILKEWGLDKE